MATLHPYRDGGYYLTKGYPLTRNKIEETRFSTYQVYPRASNFFDIAEFRDGELVPKTVFYTLLIEQDISNTYIERIKPTVQDIPRDMQHALAALDTDGSLTEWAKAMTRDRILHLSDVYQRLLKVPDWKRATRVNLAGALSLFRHFRQSGFDKELKRE